VLFWIKFPNFVQIGPIVAEYWRHIQFQDGGRGDSILLPVSYLIMSISSEGQRLSANQISSTYFDPRLRYNYFRFGKTTVRHTEILLPVSILTISPYSACHSALGCRISSKSVHPQRRYDVISIFKMAAAAAEFYFRFQSGWRRCFSDVSFYQQTKFRSYNSNRGLRYNYFRFWKTNVLLPKNV